jgi:hypothetical protein
VLALASCDNDRLPGELDTSARASSGEYARHIVETIRPPEGLEVSSFLTAAGA